MPQSISCLLLLSNHIGGSERSDLDGCVPKCDNVNRTGSRAGHGK